MDTTAAGRGSEALSTVSNKGHSQILTKAEAKSFGIGHLHFPPITIDNAFDYEKDESKPRIGGGKTSRTFEEGLIVVFSSLVISFSIH